MFPGTESPIVPSGALRDRYVGAHFCSLRVNRDLELGKDAYTSVEHSSTVSFMSIHANKGMKQ